MTFRLRPAAANDIASIALTIAEDDPLAAQRWRGRILEYCRRIGEMPYIGVARPEARPGLRLFPAGNYLIFYRITSEGVDVIRVVHGARRWRDLF
ncbi:MAG: hypothetical protein CMO30_16410 [Tistrella sp.]|uniref:Type II toxin-antitoxin system RelE/ParE family toxin n=1 Tax=Tistrella mobilis TaxID=171437 RepID=A0A3B9ITD8_9PROT|nr:type II toxin-antitoxin system RelE/ParE family toxin [Tistrella sp.]MAD40477.1 hypothetical protein [Tistrella sp.]MBA76854.1 hypothetical protein [Tistrella sp.]HAE51141.1 type II toxin-antitoxin system RelE/ParE family toxin [Tistrella mobilis]